METPDIEKQCVKCGEGHKTGDSLNHVGSKYREGNDKMHPLDTIINHAVKLKLDDLEARLRENKTNQIPTFIHLSCRNFLKNQSRPKWTSTSQDEIGSAKRISRSEIERFNFKEQCFYCGQLCFFDTKHPDRNEFQQVSTKDTKIQYSSIM